MVTGYFVLFALHLFFIMHREAADRHLQYDRGVLEKRPQAFQRLLDEAEFLLVMLFSAVL